MKKIILISVTVLFWTAFFASSSALANSFPDVAQDHKNYSAIEYLDEHQIINGYSDGTFKPDNLVNRAEALKIIIGALGVEHAGNYNVLFPDVLKEDWYFSYVMAAKELAIVSGYGDGKFRPTNTVNLAETLKMLFTAGDVSLPNVTGNVFVDVEKNDWFAPYALYAREHNIVLADDYGSISPSQSMTRGALAEVVYRMMIVKSNNGEAFPLYLNWEKYTNRTLPFAIKYDNDNWTLIEHEDEVIFLKPDKEFLQFSPTRIYPGSAVVTVTLDENEMAASKAQYFANIKNAFKGANYTEFNLGEFSALEVLYSDERIVDWYVYLDDGKVLAVYTQYGDGLLGFQLQRIIKSMLSTLEYKEVSGDGTDYSALLSQILENILVEGKGMEMLNLLPDKMIIETDTIGVGTGPVDYYYSEGVDYTFKYERAADVLLDSRSGRTTTF